MKRLVLCAFILFVAAPLLALAEAGKTPSPTAGPQAPIAAQTSAGSPRTAVETIPPTVIQTDGTGHQPANILLPHDLSPWSMFMAADFIVKVVMIGLAFASLMTWTIFLAKTFEFGLAQGRLRRGLRCLESVKSFSEAKLAIGKKDRLLKTFLVVTERELGWSVRGLRDGVQARCGSEIAELARAEVQSMRRGMPLLATIGSTAPFVGLFGTVWGIMNAFIGISKSQTTNLAVVAPGIAEALLATAIGLVAAIPAVVIYNHFSQSGRRYQSLVTKASGTVQRVLSRELDRRSIGASIEAAE